MVETNTFGATPLVLGEYDLADKTEEINRAAARCAVQARDKWSTGDRPRYALAGAIGRPPRHCPSPGGRPLKRCQGILPAGESLDGGRGGFLLWKLPKTR